VSSEVFTFQEFSIQSSSNVMPVSTDSVLLGSWADVESSKHILDVGCGNGLLGIMAAQRNRKAKIIGIDNNPQATQLAKTNTMGSSWNSRISVFQQDFTVPNWIAEEPFDSVISNPPYFEGGTHSKNEARQSYRHTDLDFFHSFFSMAYSVSSDEATLSIVIPVATRDAICLKALQFSWYLKRELFVHHTSKAPYSLCLLEWCKKHDTISSPKSYLCLYDSKQKKTPAYKELTQAFYL